MKTLNRLARSKPFIAFTAVTLLGGTVGLTQLATAANDTSTDREEVVVTSFDLDDELRAGAVSPDLEVFTFISPTEHPSTVGSTAEVTVQFNNDGASALTITRFEFRYDQDTPFTYQAGSSTIAVGSDAPEAAGEPDIVTPPEVSNPVTGEWNNSWTIPAATTTPGQLILRFNMLISPQEGGPFTISFFGDEGGDTFGPQNVSIFMVPGPTANPVDAQNTRGQNISVAPSALAAPGQSIEQSQTCLSDEETFASCTTLVDLGATVGSVTYNADDNLFTFVPFENFVGDAVAYYRVTDSLNQTATATVTFSSRAPPAATGLSQTTTVNVPVQLVPEGTPAAGLTINAAATCVRATVDGACSSDAVLGTSGALSYDVGTGNITFSPAIGFVGIANGFYSVSDNLGGQGTGTITVQVVDGTTAGNVVMTVANNGIATADPIVAPAPGASIEGICVKTTVDSEICGETATVAGGTFGYDNTNNKLTFTSNGEAASNPIIGYYQVGDSNGAAAVGQISVTVVPNPTAQAVTISTGAGNSATANLTGTPADGQTIATADTCLQEEVDTTCGSSVSKALGNFVVSNSVLTFTPANETQTGTVTAYYRVKDTLGGESAPAAITVTVLAKPSASNISGATTRGTAELLIIPSATAAPGTTLDNTKTCLRLTLNGTCSSEISAGADGNFQFIPAQNRIRFVPNPSFTGTTEIFYRVEDNLGSTDTAKVTVVVAAFTPETRPEVPATPGTPKEVANIASLAGAGYDVSTVAVSIDNGVNWSTASVNDPTKGTWSVDTGRVNFTATPTETTTVANALARIQGDGLLGTGLGKKANIFAPATEFKVFSLSVAIEAIPAGAPGRPTGVSAEPGNASARVSWVAPTNEGTSAITGYTVTSNPEAKTCTSSTTSCRVNGLSNGTAYTFTVVATNGSGSGEPSDPSPAVIPSASAVTVPDAPRNPIAIAGDGNVTVEWSAPADNGGRPILGYTVTSLPGNKECSTTGSLTCVVEGLSNGTTYTFTVVARNDVGQSLPSEPSNPATPTATPGPGPAPTPGPTVVPVPVPDGGGGGGVVPTGGGSLPKTGADVLAPAVLGIMFVIAGFGLIAMNQRRRLFPIRRA